MRIGHYFRVLIAIGLLILAAIGLSSSRAGVARLLIAPAQAEEASPLPELDGAEVERFIARNPETLLGVVALPIVFC